MAIEITKTPERNVSMNNVSKWGAAFNPQVFQYVREDFSILGIRVVEPGILAIDINKSTYTQGLDIAGIVGTKLFLKTDAGYSAWYEIVNYNVGMINIGLHIVSPVPNPAWTGVVNVPYLRQFYKIKTTIKIAGEEIVAYHTPDKQGVANVDLKAFLSVFTNSNDNNLYDLLVWRDDNKSEPYEIEVAEQWKYFDSTYTQPVVSASGFFVTHSALQFNPLGSNMGAYVPFLNEPNPDKKAKFLSAAIDPTLNVDYPFDLSLIISQEFVGKTVFINYEPLNVNGQLIGGFSPYNLLAAPGVIMKSSYENNLLAGYETSYEAQFVVDQAGVYRVGFPVPVSPFVKYINVYAYYVDAGTNIVISEKKRVSVDRSFCEEPTVYLKWLNLLGGWDYFLFKYRAEHSINVSGAVFIDREIYDYSINTATEDVLSKQAQETIKVGANGLTAEQMRTVTGIMYSNKVYLMSSGNPVEWLPVVTEGKGSTLYDTRDGFGDFELTIKLPSLNIQTA